MKKKRGVLLVFIALLVLLAPSALAAVENVNQDIIVGVIVVAILIIIVVIALMMVLKKKHKKAADLPAAPVPEKDSYMSGDQLSTPEVPNGADEVKKVSETPKESQKSSGGGGFLAKAKSLQQGGQTPPEGQKEDPYKVGGFQKEEIDQILTVPENSQGPMKSCKGCGFELVSDEKVCPVCGRKQ